MKSIDVWWRPFSKTPAFIRRFYTRDCGCGLYTRNEPAGGYDQHLDAEQFHVKDSRAMMRKLHSSARGWELFDGREP